MINIDLLSQQDFSDSCSENDSPRSSLSFGDHKESPFIKSKPCLKLDINFSMNSKGKIQSMTSIQSDFDDSEGYSMAEKDTQDFDSPNECRTPTFKSSENLSNSKCFFQSDEESKQSSPVQEHWSDYALNTPNERHRQSMQKPQFKNLKRRQQLRQQAVKQRIINQQQGIFVQSCQYQQQNQFRHIEIQQNQQSLNLLQNSSKKAQSKQNQKIQQQQQNIQNQFSNMPIQNQQFFPNCFNNNFNYQYNQPLMQIQNQQQNAVQYDQIQKQQLQQQQMFQLQNQQFLIQQQNQLRIAPSMGQNMNLSGVMWKAIQNKCQY